MGDGLAQERAVRARRPGRPARRGGGSPSIDQDRLVVLDRVDDVRAGDVGGGDDDDPRPVERRIELDRRAAGRAPRSSGSSGRTRPRERRGRRCTGPSPVSLAGPSRRSGARPVARAGVGASGRESPVRQTRPGGRPDGHVSAFILTPHDGTRGAGLSSADALRAGAKAPSAVGRGLEPFHARSMSISWGWATSRPQGRRRAAGSRSGSPRRISEETKGSQLERGGHVGLVIDELGPIGHRVPVGGQRYASARRGRLHGCSVQSMVPATGGTSPSSARSTMSSYGPAPNSVLHGRCQRRPTRLSHPGWVAEPCRALSPRCRCRGAMGRRIRDVSRTSFDSVRTR